MLHETFKFKWIDKSKPPYEWTTPGWGTFELPIKVYWKEGLGLPGVSVYNHFLSFDEPGDWKTDSVEIDKKIVDEINQQPIDIP